MASWLSVANSWPGTRSVTGGAGEAEPIDGDGSTPVESRWKGQKRSILLLNGGAPQRSRRVRKRTRIERRDGREWRVREGLIEGEWPGEGHCCWRLHGVGR